MAPLAAVCIGIRFVYKLFVAPEPNIGLDDCFILAAMAGLGANTGVMVYGALANGLGKDIMTLTPEQMTKTLMHLYSYVILYLATTALIKLSIVAFYLRIFPSRKTKIVFKATIVFVSLWGTAYALVAAFHCSPVQGFWTLWDGLHEASGPWPSHPGRFVDCSSTGRRSLASASCSWWAPCK